MPEKQNNSHQSQGQGVSPELLSLLACPQCKGSLIAEADKLACRACRLSYPVKEGIPIMLVEEAGPYGSPVA